MFRQLFAFISALFFTTYCLAQCGESGTLSVSGPGCGCLSSCDLTSVGGPDCNPPQTGNCDAGYLPMSITINIPPGCEFYVSAVFQPHPGLGCTASGADGNSTTRDRMRVGGGPWQIGPSNSTLTDGVTQTGGSVLIEGFSNRADEIITYTAAYTAGCPNPGCPACCPLPIELIYFKGYTDGVNTYFEWETASETDNDFFTIERSFDGHSFEEVKRIDAVGQSTTPQYYSTQIPEVPFGQTYYHLRQTDLNGTSTKSYTLVIHRYMGDDFRFIPDINSVYLNIPRRKKAVLTLLNLAGQVIDVQTLQESHGSGVYFRFDQPAGIYLLTLTLGQRVYSKKVMLF